MSKEQDKAKRNELIEMAKQIDDMTDDMTMEEFNQVLRMVQGIRSMAPRQQGQKIEAPPQGRNPRDKDLRDKA